MPAEARAWARVVDASALAAILFGESESEEVAARLRGLLLVAPALLRFELANVCWKKVRRLPEQRESLLAAHDFLERMEIYEVEVRLGEVLDLAERAGITAYDASYLWLARALGLELVTLDARLARAARGRLTPTPPPPAPPPALPPAAPPPRAAGTAPPPSSRTAAPGRGAPRRRRRGP